MSLALFAAIWAVALLRPAPPSTCQFHRAPEVASRWNGSCGRLFGQDPKMSLSRADSIVSGRWRSDAKPMMVWAGDMTDEGYANAAIEVEIYSRGSGVLRTEYGWYPVKNFAVTGRGLSFQIDTLTPVQPNELDREIVEHADANLSSVAVWNRADNRKCPATATTWSIYCAMEHAEVAVTGGHHHRRPAMEMVRQVIEERSAGRNYSHRLMDYNNDPTTTIADVHSLFAEALARMTGTGTPPP